MNFVRYADDFIITGESPEFLREKVLPIVRDFLNERGLQLSEEKTCITHIDDGFDFLGKNIRKYDGKLLIKPSNASIKSFLSKVRDIIKSNKSTKQETLVRKLNPVIRGWVNNQRFVVSSEVFSKVDYEIYKCLWQWAKRRHKQKGRKWIAQKYWHHIGNRQWTFSVPIEHKNADGEPLYVKLEYATDTKIIRFKKIVAEANPFDEFWTDYFEEREGEKMLNSTKGREKLLTIWRRQSRRCPVCGDLITSETGFKVHIPAKRNSQKTMIHKECHMQLHSLITNFEPDSR
jgi:RNA-directed DNA polymerase